MLRAIRIDGWEIDEDNDAELARHGIDAEIIEEVSAEETRRFRRNRKHRAATHQMIGPDRGGRFWVVCIVRTAQPFIWRPVTGWEAREREIEWYRRSQ